MTTDLTLTVSYRAIPLLELDGYEGLPKSLRESLGGLTHEQHFAAVENSLAALKAEGSRVRLVAMSAEDFRDLADRLNLDLVAGSVGPITNLHAAEMGTDDASDYPDLHAAYDTLFAGPDADELAAQVAHEAASDAFEAFHDVLGHEAAHDAVSDGYDILAAVASQVETEGAVTLVGSWKSHTLKTTVTVMMCGDCEEPHFQVEEHDQAVLGFLAAADATVVLDKATDDGYEVCAWLFADGVSTSMTAESAVTAYTRLAEAPDMDGTRAVVAPALEL